VGADTGDFDEVDTVIEGRALSYEESLAHEALPRPSPMSYWEQLGQVVRQVAPDLLALSDHASGEERGFESIDQEARVRDSESVADERADHEYDRAAAAEADYVLVRDAIAEVRSQMKAITQELEHIQDAQWLQARLIDGQLTRLEEMTGSVLAAGPGQDPGAGLAATQLASVVRQEVRSGRAQFGGGTLGRGRWDGLGLDQATVAEALEHALESSAREGMVRDRSGRNRAVWTSRR